MAKTDYTTCEDCGRALRVEHGPVCDDCQSARRSEAARRAAETRKANAEAEEDS